MNKSTIMKRTKSYHDELIKSLRNAKDSAAYLEVALEEYQEDGDTETLLVALRNVAEAKGGIGKLAKKTHLSRQHLYKLLSKSGNPRLDTFGLLLKGLGFHLAIIPAK